MCASAGPEELRITTPHLSFGARRWGDPGGEHVLALHGWLDNAATFDGVAPLLGDLDLVALDLAGHGLSDYRPAGVRYHYLDYVADAIEIADALGWQRFSLLGHSLGAGIASFVAAVAPDRVHRLALMEGLGPLSADPEGAPDQLAASIAQTARLPRKRLPRYVSMESAAEARSRAGGVSLESARILTARGARTVDGNVTWRTDPRLTVKSAFYLSEDQVMAFLGRIRASTLLVLGESGYLVPRDFMNARYGQVKDLRIERLPGGHHLHLDDPVPTARRIRRFLNATP